MRFTNLSMVAALAACGGSGDETVEYDAVARMVASTVATPDGGGTLGAVHDAIALAFGGMPVGFTYANGMTSGDHGTVHHEYMMIACRDRENRLLATCDYRTNTATMFATWSGEIHQPGLELASSRQGMWTLSDLQNWLTYSWMPMVTGTSHIQSDGVFDDGASYELTASETETLLATSQIMGGSLHLDLEVTRPGTMASAQIAADVTFDSTATALLVLDDVQHYRVDLTTGLVETATP